MAVTQRIKGQDTSIKVIVDGVVQLELSDIRNFEVTPKFHKLEEEYLGDPSKRYDEIFDGLDFKVEMHFHDANVFQFVETVRNRAVGQQRATNAVINIMTDLNFSNGTRARIMLNDCYFENLPIEFGGRAEYGQFTISGSCSDFERF